MFPGLTREQQERVAAVVMESSIAFPMTAGPRGTLG
jgi:hypothetical protein